MNRFWIACLLLWTPMVLWADARMVEAPSECHLPFSNANVDNEYKLQDCGGVIRSRGGGTQYDGAVFEERANLPGHHYIVDGNDVRDTEAYPSGVVTIITSGADSATDCNIVSEGITYSTNNWTAYTRVYRTQNVHRVNVSYQLTCTGATAQ